MLGGFVTSSFLSLHSNQLFGNWIENLRREQIIELCCCNYAVRAHMHWMFLSVGATSNATT